MGRTDARIERRRRKLHEPPCKPGWVDFAGPRLRTDGRTSVSRLCESVSCELCASRGGEWRGSGSGGMESAGASGLGGALVGAQVRHRHGAPLEMREMQPHKPAVARAR